MTRHFAIGDIHGCFDALRTLCEFVDFRPHDVIVVLGDYPDRGPDTAAVIEFLLELSGRHKVVPLRGNHDIMMLRARDGGKALRRWLEVGGQAALNSYGGDLEKVPEEHWRFLEHLLPYYETETHFFVHANAYPDIPLEEQPDFMLYWEPFGDPPPHESGKTMVCGHSSQKSGRPFTNGHAICVDTWACGTGWLTCLDVESERIWQARQSGETQSGWLDDLAARP